MTLHQIIEEANPPEGFKPVLIGGPFITENGPIFIKLENNIPIFGFRVAAGHCNSLKICHGGWISTFMDMAMPLSGRLLGELGEKFLLTISLSLDFFGQSPEGAWVEARCQLNRKTKNMVFMQGTCTVDDVPIVRASGVFRIGKPDPSMPFQLDMTIF